MRDPARIDRMLEKLRQLWLEAPDFRLGQLVVNLGPPKLPTFHVEDDVMEKRMDHVVKCGWGSES